MQMNHWMHVITYSVPSWDIGYFAPIIFALFNGGGEWQKNITL